MNEYDIAKMYQEMELNLISSLKRNLYRHLKEEEKEKITFPQWQALKLKELEKVKAENLEIIKEHTSTIPRDVKRIINREYKQGRTSAQKLYEKTKEGHGSKMNQSFFNINNKKVNALIGEINGTVRTSNSAIFRMMNDKYRSTIFKSAFFLENGAVSLKQAIDMSIKDFIKSGINCIEYADGRRVNIADYTRMAVRTASQRAMLYAEGDYRQEKGYNLVKITKHGTACKLCQPWEQQILIDDIYSGAKPDGKHKLLSEAMEAGLFHPNCRHGAPTYYPELDEVYDDIARGKTLQEEEEALRDAISQYRQRERRKEVWDNEETLNTNDIPSVVDVTLPQLNTKVFSKEYEEVLNKMIEKAKNKKRFEVTELKEFILDGKTYDNNSDLIFEYSDSEKHIAKIISDTLGGKVYLLPNLSNYNKKKMADYLWNGERWDLKTITKEAKGDNVFTNQAKKAKDQANNIIIQIDNQKLSKDNEVLKGISRIYGSARYNYIDKIIIVIEHEVKYFFKRK